MKKNIFKEWLERLQQESWQLELIISGFAIFALIQAKEPAGELIHLLRQYEEPVLFFPLMLICWAINIGLNIFLINLIMHVIIRGLWIGAIGLRYVSGDIDYESLNLSPAFHNYLKSKNQSFDDYIGKLESVSSVIFSFTFLLVFILFSIIIFLCSLMVVFLFLAYLPAAEQNFSNNVKIGNKILAILFLVYFLFTSFCLVPVLVDFFGLGILKRIKNVWFSKFFLFCYRYISTLSLSSIWRPLWLNFMDNKSTRKIVFLIPVYFLVLSLPSAVGYNSFPFFPNLDNPDNTNSAIFSHSYSRNFYDDEREKAVSGKREPIKHFSIPSKIISSHYLQVFVKNSMFDYLYIQHIDSTCVPLYKRGFFSIFNKPKQDLSNIDFHENLQKIKEISASAISISIDSVLVPKDSIAADFYVHPNKDERGMLLFIPISNLRKGRHTLKVKKQRLLTENVNDITRDSLEIPFIYDPNS